MNKYCMELPNLEYATIQIAYNYIKKAYPHLIDGFNMSEEYIQSFRNDYLVHTFWWNDKMSFLGWGYGPNEETIIIPFPDVDCIVLGDIK